jgi:hypothetical protein
LHFVPECDVIRIHFWISDAEPFCLAANRTMIGTDSRKRSSTSSSSIGSSGDADSSNRGPREHRSVVDYETEEQLRHALLQLSGNGIGDGGNHVVNADLIAMVAAIQEGQPVQKVNGVYYCAIFR